jgi:hypothetical protein
MSLIEFAPATMPATPAPTPEPWIGALVSRHAWHVASPARAASATSGANRAHDTRFGRDPSTFPRAEKGGYFTEIIE